MMTGFFGLFGTSVHFDQARDIPSLDGKVILVTGANIGLGKQAVLEYARHSPKRIYLAARNLDKAAAALEDIKREVPNAPVKILQLDLASFESVKKAAKTFCDESDRLDILMLNAGVMAAAPDLTKEGYEYQFGTNHMGHALLAKLLIPVLERTAKSSEDADVRIVSLASLGHRFAPPEGIIFDMCKVKAESMGPFGRYHQSKMANVLFARHLAKLYPQFTVASVHPGAVTTNLLYGATGTYPILLSIGPYLKRFCTPVDQGVRNQLWASVSKDVKSGEYYEPVGVHGKVEPKGMDDKLAKKLWDWTQKELEGHEIS